MNFSSVETTSRELEQVSSEPNDIDTAFLVKASDPIDSLSTVQSHSKTTVERHG